MSRDYLDALAARDRLLEGALAPRIPARFEPTSLDAPIPEPFIHDAPDGARAPQTYDDVPARVVRPHADHLPRSESPRSVPSVADRAHMGRGDAPDRDEGHPATPHPRVGAPSTHPPTLPTDTSPREADDTTREGTPAEQPSPVRAAVVEVLPARRIEPASNRRFPPQVVQPRADGNAPMRRDDHPAEARANAVAQPSSIQVTIGRIEVRAVHPAPAPPPPPRRVGSMTLAQYLGERRDGRR